MTRDRQFDSGLADLLWELAPAPDPASIERTLEVTSRTRQRRSWTFVSRWLPFDPEAAVASTGMPRVVLVALLLVLALVAGLLYAGARIPARPRLPEPFGPAGNGLVVYASGGDLYTVDPATDAVTLIVGGPEADGSADFSPNGTQLFFVREIDGEPWLMVATADGQSVQRVMDRPASGVLSGAWSPDSDSIAMVSDLNGRSRISIHPVSGTAVTTLDLGVDAAWPAYRPPDGRQLVFRGVKDGRVDLYLVDPDGGNLSPLGLTSLGLRGPDMDLLAPAWSPDGRLIAYHTVDDVGGGVAQTRVHILDLATGENRVLAPQPANVHQGWALWSPDGTRIAVQRWEDDGIGRFAIISLDDPGGDVAVGPATPPERGAWIGTWSPDGSRLIEYLDAEMGLLSVDPSSGDVTKLDWPAEEPVGYQRVAP